MRRRLRALTSALNLICDESFCSIRRFLYLPRAHHVVKGGKTKTFCEIKRLEIKRQLPLTYILRRAGISIYTFLALSYPSADYSFSISPQSRLPLCLFSSSTEKRGDSEFFSLCKPLSPFTLSRIMISIRVCGGSLCRFFPPPKSICICGRDLDPHSAGRKKDFSSLGKY